MTKTRSKQAATPVKRDAKRKRQRLMEAPRVAATTKTAIEQI